MISITTSTLKITQGVGWYIDLFIYCYNCLAVSRVNGEIIYSTVTGLNKVTRKREWTQLRLTEKVWKYSHISILESKRTKEDTLITCAAQPKSPYFTIHFYTFLGQFSQKRNH